ncbi:MerR family transcriptional regulator [Parasphingorhabdus sp. DH2-15]|uniref:MerR family transcriptional regulator n=1 Tax=Parasphingorhabdus sp. DH2-15 TaxID=3444112 RepID=UPI003F685D81
MAMTDSPSQKQASPKHVSHKQASYAPDADTNAPIDMRELVRRTGLTSRALRFYEARGLIAPLRTYKGKRLFGPAELERVHRIVVLKSAGLSLSQMKDLFDGKTVDLAALLNAQLAMLNEQSQQIKNAQTVINFALSRIARSEPLDAATFCSLIESGDKMMNQEPKEWKEVTDRYFSPQEKAHWAEQWEKVPADFDAEAYAAQWKELGDAIKAALPMAPDSDMAQHFVDKWYDLLKPMAEFYTPEMWNGAARLYDNMDEWAGKGADNNKGQPDPGFDKQVWDFIKLATAARIAKGDAPSPLASDFWPATQTDNSAKEKE